MEENLELLQGIERMIKPLNERLLDLQSTSTLRIKEFYLLRSSLISLKRSLKELEELAVKPKVPKFGTFEKKANIKPEVIRAPVQRFLKKNQSVPLLLHGDKFKKEEPPQEDSNQKKRKLTNQVQRKRTLITSFSTTKIETIDAKNTSLRSKPPDSKNELNKSVTSKRGSKNEAKLLQTPKSLQRQMTSPTNLLAGTYTNQGDSRTNILALKRTHTPQLNVMKKYASSKDLGLPKRRVTVSSGDFSSGDINLLTIEKQMKKDMALKIENEKEKPKTLKKNNSYCEPKGEPVNEQNTEKIVVRRRSLRTLSLQQLDLMTDKKFSNTLLPPDMNVIGPAGTEVEGKVEKCTVSEEKCSDFTIKYSLIEEQVNSENKELKGEEEVSAQKGKSETTPLKERNIQDNINIVNLQQVNPTKLETPPHEENKRKTIAVEEVKRSKTPNSKLATIAENFESEEAFAQQSASKERFLSQDPTPLTVARNSIKRFGLQKHGDSETKALSKLEKIQDVSMFDSLCNTPQTCKSKAPFSDKLWYEKNIPINFDFEDALEIKGKPINYIPIGEVDWVLSEVDYNVWEVILSFAGLPSMLSFRAVSKKGHKLFIDYFDNKLAPTQEYVYKNYLNIKRESRELLMYYETSRKLMKNLKKEELKKLVDDKEVRGEIRKILALACFIVESHSFDFNQVDVIKSLIRSDEFYTKLSKLNIEKIKEQKMKYFMFEMGQIMDIKKIRELGPTIETLYNYLLNNYMMWRLIRKDKKNMSLIDVAFWGEYKALFEKMKSLFMRYSHY